MIVKGRIRGGGRQLASYLLSMQENERVNLVYVDGQARVNAQDFRRLLGDFSLMEKLTRSSKGIYHATINPPEDFAGKMSKDDWIQTANILAKELGFEGQRMALVMHRKHNREHLHVVMERYKHETGTMISISHNYRAHLKAGREMAQVFGLQQLPERNKRRSSMKDTLTKLWKETPDAKSFIKEAKKSGYLFAKGHEKPFLVIDEFGRAFNLVRHLEAIKTKDVRERFKGTVLMNEREAIAFVSNQRSLTQQQTKQTVNDEKTAFLETLKNTRKQQTQKPRIR